MGLTSDPEDPRLGHGVDKEPIDQHDVYLVLSDEERVKGFIRPLRRAYRHVGAPAPRWPLRDLTARELEMYAGVGYVKYEEYPADDHPVTGRFWTQAQLDNTGKGCGTVTTMALGIAETYARNPQFYGATYCVGCRMHLPVGRNGVFVWDDGGADTEERVGT